MYMPLINELNEKTQLNVIGRLIFFQQYLNNTHDDANQYIIDHVCA